MKVTLALVRLLAKNVKLGAICRVSFSQPPVASLVLVRRRVPLNVTDVVLGNMAQVKIVVKSAQLANIRKAVVLHANGALPVTTAMGPDLRFVGHAKPELGLTKRNRTLKQKI